MEEGAEGEGLAERPVDLAVGLVHVATGVELLGQLRVHREPVGHVVEGGEHLVEVVTGDAGLDLGAHAHVHPLGGVGDGGGRCLGPGLVEGALQPSLEVVERGLGLLDGDVALLHEQLGVDLSHGAAGVDASVHERLRVAGVVALVVAVAAVAEHVDDDVLVERLPVGEGQPGHAHDRFGVVAVDVEDRGLDHLRHVGGVLRGPSGGRRRGEAELVVDDHVDRAAHAVALDVGQVERLGDHTLAGERGVAVDQHREHRVVARRLDQVHLCPRHPDHHGVDGFEVRGVGRQLDADGVAPPALELPGLAEVVLHVARALDRIGVDVALELVEELLVALPDDVDQHVQPTAVGHAEHGRVHVCVGGLGQHGVEQRDGRFGAVEAEALLTEVLRAEELLEGLGGVEPLEDVVLLVHADLDGDPLHVLLDPALLGGLLDVHVLDADRAAVGVAQHVQHVVELHAGASTDAAGEELPIEVPDGESVGRRIELRVQMGLLARQRVEVGDEVAADPVHVHELLDLHLLVEHGGFAVDGVHVATPLDGLVGHPDRAEDLLVEVVLAHQQLVDPLQEEPRLGALDDAVVVGRGDRHDLRHAEVGEHGRVRALVLGRVAQAAHAHDQALTRHEARHGLHGADRARVREAHGDPGEVVGAQLVGPDLADQVLVGAVEAGEVESVGVSDARHQQGPAPVGLLEVDGDAEADVVVANDPGLAVGSLEERRVHDRRGVGDRSDDGGCASRQASRARSASSTCSPAGRSRASRSRGRHHAVHHGQHHHAGPRRGDPEAGGTPERGCGRPAQDHAVHPLPHDRARDAAGHRSRVHLRHRPRHSVLLRRQCGADRAAVARRRLAAGLPDHPDARRRHRGVDVDGRNDLPARHRQRHVDDHLRVGRAVAARWLLEHPAAQRHLLVRGDGRTHTVHHRRGRVRRDSGNGEFRCSSPNVWSAAA